MKDAPPAVTLCLPLAGEVPEGIVTHHPAFGLGEQHDANGNLK